MKSLKGVRIKSGMFNCGTRHVIGGTGGFCMADFGGRILVADMYGGFA